jgi:hypothetical protein
VEWAFLPTPRPAEAAPLPEKEDPWKDYLNPDETFPRNGVHVHDGIIHVTFIGKTGKEVTWSITNVRTKLSKGRRADADAPLRGRLLRRPPDGRRRGPPDPALHGEAADVDVRDADVARIAEGAPFITHPMKGKLNGVLALTRDEDKLGCRVRSWPATSRSPTAISGRCPRSRRSSTG